MDDDLVGRMSFLRARVAEQAERSRKLSGRALALGRALDAYAAAASARNEAQFDRLAVRLPRRYGLCAPDGDRQIGEQLDFLLKLAGAIYPGARSASVAAIHVTDSRAPPGADLTASRGSSRAASMGVYTARTRAWSPEQTWAARDPGLADVAQYASGEGLCLDAVEMDQVAVVAAPDLGEEPALSTWPRAGAMLLDLGVRSVVSIAIPWSRRWSGRPDPARPPVAAITLYSAEAHALDRPEELGLLLGAYAGSRLTGKTPAEVLDAAILRPRWAPPGWDVPYSESATDDSTERDGGEDR